MMITMMISALTLVLSDGMMMMMMMCMMMITMMTMMISALIFVLSDDTLEKLPPSVLGLLITPTCLPAKSIPSSSS